MPVVRVLHLPSNPADQAGIVVRTLRDLGHDAELWHFGPSPFGFDVDRVIDIDDHDPRSIWPHLLEAIERFDVFHFHYGRSFFSQGWQEFPLYWDLPLLRMLGKKIIFTFHGSDCRTPEAHAKHNPFSHLFFEHLTPDVDRIAKSIAVISTYADHLAVVSAELRPYVPGSVVVERAFPLAGFAEQPAAQREIPVLLHAPSRRSVKGTERIVEVLDTLKAEGVRFEFRMIEGLPHDEVLALIRDADVVIDQVVMGDHGVVSVEAMAANRVAVAYLTDPVRKANPGSPVYLADPDTFKDRMRELIIDADLRMKHASAGRAYVAEHFDAAVIAQRCLALYAAEPATRARRMFPDWMTVGSARTLEGLQEQVARETAHRRALQEEVGELKRSARALERQLAAARRFSLTRVAPTQMRRAAKRLLKRP